MLAASDFSSFGWTRINPINLTSIRESMQGDSLKMVGVGIFPQCREDGVLLLTI